MIDSVTLSFSRGEFHVILGSNGSGKSTLLKLFSKLLPADKGSIASKGRIGIAFQNPDNQFVYSKLGDDVSFGPINQKHSEEEIADRVKEALDITALTDKRNRLVDTLSGGEKGRASLAGILAMDADILLLDEVLSMQDVNAKKEFLSCLRNLKNQGKTIVLVTHDVSDAIYADYAHVMKGGRLIASGKRRDILSDVDVLKNSNIAPPMIALYAKALEKRGVSFSFIPTTVEEFKEAICI